MSSLNVFLGLGKLVPKTGVPIDHLYLDPNNPRFMGAESKNITPIDRYTLPKVQQKALDHMKNYGLKELKDNIEEIGFLPIDKMVFAQIGGKPNEYYALEGNRRLAAIKSLLEDQEVGERILKEEIMLTLKKIDIYVLEDAEDLGKAQNIIQGIRHMSGIRDWRPYQKSKVINQLFSEEKSAADISKMFGISSHAVMRYYRAFLAFEEFKSDETYGEHWNVELFRMFDDVMRRPRLRIDWLGWDDKINKFKNITELEFFYNWIIPDLETKERKIPGANYIKDLDKIVAHPDALEYLKNEGTSLASALAMTRERPQMPWISKIEDVTKALKRIEADELEKLSSENEQKLKDLQKEITKAIERSKKLKKLT